ncbi:DUF7344 domain-containing protein [Halomicrococcus sp. SG-WS-1]|uniref:DUF7344 domain-containing protein n=1 Tax=Halomicrococcus sp. SG-WS-1 TaxID=3439057 RepID=UPI003F79ABBE
MADTAPDSLRILLEILAEPRRRYALYHLRRHETATVTRLADNVAGWMNADRSEPLPAERHVRIYTDLHHTDVPKLSAAGLIRYDEDEERVETAEFPDVFEKLLDVTLEFDSSQT